MDDEFGDIDRDEFDYSSVKFIRTDHRANDSDYYDEVFIPDHTLIKTNIISSLASWCLSRVLFVTLARLCREWLR